ncbi:MAG: hypothetical protein HN712_30055 [Gemmatimonadetes bacterium]|jgi:hypothetical protein|nr:hypothetical protein [Gemmatimonadota bacterium]MBT6147322.1 hypothetical protein [Gemmatimonadota bacterium]MBT7864587.1 hypothetical protein [Gemmatimonadota bacterium]
MSRTLMFCLACAVGLAGCGDDDSKEDETPTGPDLSANQELLVEMQNALEKAVALIFTGGGSVPGAGGGQVVVEGTSFIFQEYSPDGELMIDGQLDLNILASPVTLKGTIELTGSMEYPVIVDMTIDVRQEPFLYGGTLTVDGEIYDVAELEEEAQS